MKSNLFTTFLCINVPFFMFAHIYFLYHPEINKGAILGYKYWSVFFASLMYPVLFFAFAYLFQRVTKIYIKDKKGKMFSNILISTLYFFSLFYLIITIFPYANSYKRIGLDPFAYYIVSSISSICIVLIIMYLPNKILSISKNKLQYIIHILFKGYYEDLEKKDLINPWKKEEFVKFRVNLTEKVVKHEQG
tara:strand:+ start:1238 stop:1810 length:573 start_codon:yes stop_codon:yes gene_type:complete